jgi:hypothetical protein
MLKLLETLRPLGTVLIYNIISAHMDLGSENTVPQKTTSVAITRDSS